MKKIAIPLAVLAVSALWLTAYLQNSRAQTSGATVVATCGTLPQAYVAGTTRNLTVNTNGQVCQ